MSVEIDGHSLDLKAQRLEQLKGIFPEFFTEGKIDLARVRELLGDELAEADHYELSWAGKSEARKEIQKQTTAALIPDREGSVDFDTSENIFIEGENLEVLRVLQKSYFGKIKMIYIDPPYNTGNDSFIYPDNYMERKEDYEKRAGIRGGDGHLNKLDLFKKNTKESGQYHSVWLSMMYPRLYLARNLLREDGVIFVSIDDNEVANATLLLNEIFGEENFIAKIIWHNSSRSGDYVAIEHEYILAFARNRDALGDAWRIKREESEVLKRAVSKVQEDGGLQADAEKALREIISRYAEQDKLKGTKKHSWLTNYSNVDEEWQIYYAVDLSGEGEGPPRTFGGKEIPAPPGRHWMSQEYIDELYAENRIVWRGDRAYRKLYIDETEETLKAILNFPTRRGSELLKSLLGRDIFTKPKPVELIKHLLRFATEKDQVVLDFFAGSCSTGHAVMELNHEDGGHRKFICVQMPETVDENTEAYKAGYRTIADIGKSRLQKIINRLKGDNGALEYEEARQDLGFKAYQLSYSNFKKWRAEITNKEDLLNQLAMFTEPLENKPADSYILLVELMVKAGLPLTSKVERRESEDNAPYFVVGTNRLVFALDKVSDALLAEIERIKPQTLVVLGNLFEGERADELMTNWRLQLKESEIEFRVI